MPLSSKKKERWEEPVQAGEKPHKWLGMIIKEANL
jgi:hypothetical protein